MSTYYFGLNVKRSFAEIANTEQSLKNINLDINDLNKIRNISGAGVISTDLQTLSGLNYDIEKDSYSLVNDTLVYDSLTSKVFDKNSYINTNLNIKGSVSSAAFKYNYVDFSTDTIKKADVSTSRISSWSTLESTLETPITNSSPIYYGGEVVVQGPIELSNLVFNNTSIETREFNSEIPTHRIKMNIDGEDIYVYAMKGIPLKYDGFFNIATVSAVVSPIPGNASVKPSWVIRSTSNTSDPVYKYKDILSSTTSAISFKSASSANRTIEFYYPPDYITSLNLTNINLSNLPKVSLANLTSLNISINNFKEFPDLTKYTNLSTLNISRNDLSRSLNSNIKTFSQDVLSKLPSSIRTLTMGETYGGIITANLATIPLTTLDLSSTNLYGRVFTGNTPDVNSSTIQTYNMLSNAFTKLSNTVMTSTSLKTIQLSNNRLVQNNVSFSSTVLESVGFGYIYGNINLINVSGKANLLTYGFSNMNTIDESNSSYPNDVETIFNNCEKLKTISMRSAPVKGRFPRLVACSALTSLDLLNTLVSSYSSSYILENTTFDSCRSTLQTLYWESPNIGLLPIQSNTFKGMKNLSQLYISSRNFGLNGTLSSDLFSDCRALSYLWLHNNNLTGDIPSFTQNNNLFYLYAPFNKFTGAVPNINKTSLKYIYLQNNLIESFEKIDSTGLLVLNIANNRIVKIPDISNLTALTQLDLSNNLVSKYTTGSFAKMRNIQSINLNNNQLDRGYIDQILRDLNTNYNLAPRKGVTVNLNGGSNESPSPTSEIQNIILKLSSSGWNISVK